jgi:hypothetical protein
LQDQIFSQKSDALDYLPNHTVTLDKHQCRRRRLRKRPSQLHWLFRVYRVFVELQQDPKRYDRYVVLLLDDFFENHHQLAKFFTELIRGSVNIRLSTASLKRLSQKF